MFSACVCEGTCTFGGVMCSRVKCDLSINIHSTAELLGCSMCRSVIFHRAVIRYTLPSFYVSVTSSGVVVYGVAW